VKLYVCYGTWGDKHHYCGRAHKALQAAGHDPEVIRSYGCLGTDRFFKGRCAVRKMTGNFKVPTLVLDDGTVIDSSETIAEWARSHELGTTA
jgi:hypothetical protein